MITIRLLAFAVLLAIPVVPAAAAEGETAHFPARSMRIVVPFPPGGPADIISRLIAQRMSEHWRTPVMVENRPGANTAIGAQAVAKSAPDGLTLLAGMDTTLVTNPLLSGNLPYEVGDFAPITLLAKNMSLLVVRRDGPTSVAEVIAKAKANPGKLNMGAGTITSRLGALAFVQGAGIDVALIPYKGSAEIVQGLLSRSVDFAFDSTASSLPLIKGGSFRALAKYSPHPLPALPDLPSLADAVDLLGLRESSTWIGLLAPAATPSAIIDKIAREVADIYGEPTVMERLDAAGLFPVVSTPAEFEAFIRAETDRWSKIIKDNPNLRLD